MKRRATITTGLGLSSLALVACSAIIGTRDLTLVSGDDAGAGDDQGKVDGSVDASIDGTAHPLDGGPEASSAEAGAEAGGEAGAEAGGEAGAEAGACTASTDLTSDKHNCGRCGHDCFGGECKASVCQPITIVNAQSGAHTIAVDATSIYWTDIFNGRVLKADKDGQNVTILAQGSSAYSACGLALDSANVYWTIHDQSAGTIERCPKTGCNQSGQSILTRALDLPCNLAIDGTSMYWAENDGVGAIGRVELADGGKSGYLVTNETEMSGVAVDDASVYFSSQVTVGRIGKNVPEVDASDRDAAVGFTTFASGGLYAFNVTIDGTNLYWTEENDPGGAVRFVPKVGVKDGGLPTTVTDAENNPFGIVVDATNVYWTALGSNTSTDSTVDLFVGSYVATCPKAGCGNKLPTLLAVNQARTLGITADDTAIYVAIYGNVDAQGNISGGSIMKVAKP